MNQKIHMSRFEIDKSQGDKFGLGSIIRDHNIGDFSFLEYDEKGTDIRTFAIYLNGNPIGSSAYSLDDALVVAIANKYDGKGSQAPQYVIRLLGMDK